MKEFAVYTAARLGVFVGCYAGVLAVVVLVGGRGAATGIWPLAVAVLLSAAVSAYVLRGLRDRFAASVQARADRIVTNSRRD